MRGGVPPAVVAALLAAVVVALPGCLSCEPLLEVRHCLDGQARCLPEDWSDDAKGVNWTTELAAAWPDVTALMDATDLGTHAHLKWTPEREDALWAAFGVSGDEPELFVTYRDDVYRVRVLTCR